MFVPSPSHQLQLARDLRQPDLDRAAAARRLRGDAQPAIDVAVGHEGQADQRVPSIGAWLARLLGRPTAA